MSAALVDEDPHGDPDLDRSASVLKKAFRILDAFDHHSPVLTINAVTRRTGLPKSTAYRILNSLIELGAVERDRGGYRLGRKMVELGTRPAETAMRAVAQPHLRRLHGRSGHTLHLAVLDDTSVLYVDKIASPASAPSPAVVGGRLPAYRTGVGKALLAWHRPIHSAGRPLVKETLIRVRDTGVAYDHGEARAGLECIAVPIIIDRRAVAAVSVSFPSGLSGSQRLIVPLRETADSIGREFARIPMLSARSHDDCH